jgi:phosphohistidine phosphatase
MKRKRLVLLRHAKSSWDDNQLDDHDRPLNGRGRRAAAQLGRYLNEQGLAPAQVLCSSAVRARQTLELLQLAGRPRILVETELYGASAGELIDRLRRVDDAVDSVMVIGHNPGIHDLAVTLSADAEGIPSFPTAALAELTLPGDRWSDLQFRGATLARVVMPKNLPPLPG